MVSQNALFSFIYQYIPNILITFCIVILVIFNKYTDLFGSINVVKKLSGAVLNYKYVNYQRKIKLLKREYVRWS